MPARRLWIAPLLAAVLLLPTACSGGDPSTADPADEASASPDASEAPDESPSPSPSQEPDPALGRYVALGDSYTAAPFVPTTEQESGCLRSDSNYPQLLAASAGVGELVDVSCSGADATALVGNQRTPAGPVPPQFEALTEDTDLVTVGLGGNDFDIFATLIGRCPALAERDPDGSPCRDAQQRDGEDRLLALLPDLRARMTAVLTGIADRAPEATVVFVGYPQLAPAQGTCPDLLPLATGDIPYLREVTTRLNAALRGAAEGAGATYVDVAGPSAGHDICSAEPWINGRTTDQSRALAYHPFAIEQEAVAGLVAEALDRSLADAGAA